MFLDRLRGRDPEAISSLVYAYGRQLYRAGRGSGLDHEAAEEAVQSTFLALLESIERFEGRSKVRTYLFGIFFNKVRELWRELRRSEAHDPIDEVVESRFDRSGGWLRPPEDLDARIGQSEFLEFLRECMTSLPSLQRSVFHLREVEELSTQEICKILEISDTHVAVTLHRARNRLRECLESKGMKGA